MAKPAQSQQCHRTPLWLLQTVPLRMVALFGAVAAKLHTIASSCILTQSLAALCYSTSFPLANPSHYLWELTQPTSESTGELSRFNLTSHPCDGQKSQTHFYWTALRFSGSLCYKLDDSTDELQSLVTTPTARSYTASTSDIHFVANQLPTLHTMLP